jgi:hypothetical protein
VEDLELLWHEFSAGDGSFLTQLRIDLHWDRQAFSRLEQAMRRVCAEQEPRQQLDRWLAEGYWYLSDFVPAHVRAPHRAPVGAPELVSRAARPPNRAGRERVIRVQRSSHERDHLGARGWLIPDQVA